MSHNYPYRQQPSDSDLRPDPGPYGSSARRHVSSDHNFYRARQESLSSSSSRGAQWSQDGAHSILSSCGLEPEDLALLAELPEDVLTVESLPHVLKQIKGKRGTIKPFPPNALSSSSSSFPTSSTCRPTVTSDWDRSHSVQYPLGHLKPSPLPFDQDLDCWGNPRTSSTVTADPSSSSSYVVDFNHRPGPSDYGKTGRDAGPVSSQNRAFFSSAGRSKRNRSSRFCQPGPADHRSAPPPAEYHHPSESETSSIRNRHRPPASVPCKNEAKDFHGTCPPVFPYSCSLCDITVMSEKVWIKHINGTQHADGQLSLLQKFPKWDCRMETVSRAGSQSEQWKDEGTPGQQPQTANQNSRHESQPNLKPLKKTAEKGKVVCVKFPAQSVDETYLRKLTEPFGKIVKILMFPSLAFVELGSTDQAKDLVKFHVNYPPTVNGQQMEFRISNTFTFLQSSRVVSFCPAPTGEGSQSDLLSIIKRFGLPLYTLFLPSAVFVEMKNSPDAQRMVDYYSSNTLRINNDVIKVNFSGEYKTLAHVASAKRYEEESSLTKRMRSSSRDKEDKTTETKRRRSSKDQEEEEEEEEEEGEKSSRDWRTRTRSREKSSKEKLTRTRSRSRETSRRDGRTTTRSRSREKPPKDKTVITRSRDKSSSDGRTRAESRERSSKEKTTRTRSRSREKSVEPERTQTTDTESRTDPGPAPARDPRPEAEERESSAEESDIEGMEVIGEDGESLEDDEEEEEDEMEQHGHHCPAERTDSSEEEKELKGEKKVKKEKPINEKEEESESIRDAEETAETQLEADEEEPGFPVDLENCITLDELQEEQSDDQDDEVRDERECPSSCVVSFRNLPLHSTDTEFINLVKDFGTPMQYFRVRQHRKGFIEMSTSSEALRAVKEMTCTPVSFKGSQLIVQISNKHTRLTNGLAVQSPKDLDKEKRSERLHRDESHTNSEGRKEASQKTPEEESTSKTTPEKESYVKKSQRDTNTSTQTEETDSAAKMTLEKETCQENSKSKRKGAHENDSLESRDETPRNQELVAVEAPEEMLEINEKKRSEEMSDPGPKDSEKSPDQPKPQTQQKPDQLQDSVLQVEQPSGPAGGAAELKKPTKPVGAEFVRPVVGYFCNLCQLIYADEDKAKVQHCSSQMHYRKYQEKTGKDPWAS